MFGLGKKIDQILGIVLKNNVEIVGRNDLIAILRDENKELRKQVRDLLDRLMARDFEQLQLFQPVTSQDMFEAPPPFSSEELAGDVSDGDEE